MSNTATHNARLMTISYAGKTIDGLKQDSFLTFEPAGDIMAFDRSIDGTRAPSILSDRSGIVTIKTMSQGPVNKWFLGIVEGVFDVGAVLDAPLYVKGDNGGVVFYKLNDCMLKTRPGLDIGNDMSGSEVEWTFDCNSAEPIPLSEFELSVSVRADIQGSLDLGFDFSIAKAL